MSATLIQELVFKQLFTEDPANTKCFDCGKQSACLIYCRG